MALTLAGFLFGFGLGGVFGAAEASIKGTLKASADAVLDTVYAGDAAKAKAVVSKSWSYCKRAHMHGGGMAAAALAMILLLAAMPACGRYKFAASTMLGIGALGYPLFWLLAAFRAPGMGSTGAAKESLAFLALPTSGCFIAGTAAVAVGFCVKAFRSAPTEA
jgi:hypothetical protein